ncbi:MAG: hypothetical protein U0R44_04590 [Candidatus Micrarchaeia archaeon]
MSLKNLYAVIGVLLFGASLVLAIGGATPTVVSESRWAGAAAGSDVTEGGNITVVNVSGMQLTDKWAAYYGNVSGSIILGDPLSQVYVWTWTPSTGGEVCLSEGSAFNFATAGTSTGSAVDLAYGFTGTDADSGNNTFSGSCNLTFASSSVTGTQFINDASAYDTCLVNSGGAAKANLAFCTKMGSSPAYNSAPANYEVMVPTSTGTGTETYYFYFELG